MCHPCRDFLIIIRPKFPPLPRWATLLRPSGTPSNIELGHCPTLESLCRICILCYTFRGYSGVVQLVARQPLELVILVRVQAPEPIFSGGLQVADAPLARQSSAASGKPALWRRRVEPAPVSLSLRR